MDGICYADVLPHGHALVPFFFFYQGWLTKLSIPNQSKHECLYAWYGTKSYMHYLGQVCVPNLDRSRNKRGLQTGDIYMTASSLVLFYIS